MAQRQDRRPARLRARARRHRSPAPRRPPVDALGTTSAASSGSRSRPSTTCSASGAIPRSPASRSAATCASARRRCRSSPRSARADGRRTRAALAARRQPRRPTTPPSGRPSSSSGAAAGRSPSDIARPSLDGGARGPRRRRRRSPAVAAELRAARPVRRREGLVTVVEATDVGALADATARGVDWLRTMQHRDGWWKGELETNVTMDAEDLLLRQFLGVLDPELATATGAWIRSQQRDDGTWATFHGGPGRPVDHGRGLRRAAPRRRRARRRAHARRPRRSSASSGGIEAARVFTRIWLALFGAVVVGRAAGAAARGDAAAAVRCRSTSTTSPAGPARRSCRSRSSAPTARCARCRSASTSCDRGGARDAGPRRRRIAGGPLRRRSTACCTRYERRPSAPAAASGRWPRPSAGSSPARRPTARGAASSRRGSTR